MTVGSCKWSFSLSAGVGVWVPAHRVALCGKTDLLAQRAHRALLIREHRLKGVHHPETSIALSPWNWAA